MKLNKRPSVPVERMICSMPWDLPIKMIHKYILAHQNVWNMLVSGILILIPHPAPPTPNQSMLGWHALLHPEWNSFLMLFDLLPSLVRESIETLPEATLSQSTNCELETTFSGFHYNYWTDKKKKLFMILASNPVRKWNWTSLSVSRIRFELWENKHVFHNIKQYTTHCLWFFSYISLFHGWL